MNTLTDASGLVFLAIGYYFNKGASVKPKSRKRLYGDLLISLGLFFAMIAGTVTDGMVFGALFCAAAACSAVGATWVEQYGYEQGSAQKDT